MKERYAAPNKTLEVFKMEKVLLGKVSKDYKGEGIYVTGERVLLSKHEWDCGWYWGFGYVGNRDLHCHFEDQFLKGETSVDRIFEETKISQATWWLLRDLFVQAYALKKCAAVYRHGGHQTSKAGVTDMIRDDAMCTRLNADLKTVLDKIWSLLTDK
jgi:hypothetical protein